MNDSLYLLCHSTALLVEGQILEQLERVLAIDGGVVVVGGSTYICRVGDGGRASHVCGIYEDTIKKDLTVNCIDGARNDSDSNACLCGEDERKRKGKGKGKGGSRMGEEEMCVGSYART